MMQVLDEGQGGGPHGQLWHILGRRQGSKRDLERI
ncbi:expressed unknown protein [Ectocarpus siliculosus]|uniref:Uncharacterized protein n=1 Tax=Ectocarpus siliculosus TaxID=2880 RepID=D7G3U6_ECTSI|nr:expressed unknown protein [Ectocarpus siliculosus]|eukprot:CBJ33623.1 expressed unknown protein [Ectocarpus siliculosus]